MGARKIISAPTGHGVDGKLMFSGPTAISVTIEPDSDGNPQFDLVDAPDGARALVLQHRMTGDFYAEFTGEQGITCAVAGRRVDAVRIAASRMASAA